MTTVPPRQLPALLRAAAAGSYGHEAATDLLIAHRTWIYRDDFLTTCVDWDDAQAWVYWQEIPQFLERAAGSSSELRILALAAQLADIPTGHPLGDLLSGLDNTNARLVTNAIAHVLSRGGQR